MAKKDEKPPEENSEDKDKKEETPPAPDFTDQFSDLKESLESIKTDLTTRLDEIEERTKPPEPTPEPEKWEPKDWSDVPAKAKEIAEQVADEKLTAYQEEQKKAAQETADKQAAIDKEIDDAIVKLETDNRLPKVENPDNTDDKGRVARRELLGFAAKMETLNLDKAMEALEKFHEQGIAYDYKSTTFVKTEPAPAGQSAPVGSSSKTTESSGKPTYDDIHKAPSLDALIRKFGES